MKRERIIENVHILEPNLHRMFCVIHRSKLFHRKMLELFICGWFFFVSVINFVLFFRIRIYSLGEIDTLNEKYQADVYYEARWTENMDALKLTPDELNHILHDHRPLKAQNAKPNIPWSLPWTPGLLIENEIGQIGTEEKWYTLRRVIEKNKQVPPSPTVIVNICEHRKWRGIFWEKLELNHVSVIL